MNSAKQRRFLISYGRYAWVAITTGVCAAYVQLAPPPQDAPWSSYALLLSLSSIFGLVALVEIRFVQWFIAHRS